MYAQFDRNSLWEGVRVRLIQQQTGVMTGVWKTQTLRESLIGRQLGVYQVGPPIGRGGIGEVYEATHLRTGRKYAIKILLNPDPDAVRRFRREAEALAAIGHPGVVAIHDFDSTSDGVTYLVMDRLQGEDLAACLSRGPMTVEHALARLAEIAGALHAAHRAGVLHRDLKPSNIFLSRPAGAAHEHAMLLDFGLAKPVQEGDETRLTATGVTMGTPLYMSPEQALGDELDVRSDVYSLAAVFYEMLCGKPPFEGPTLTAILSKVLTFPPPPFSHHDVQVPAFIESVVLSALAKTPEGRPNDVAAFLAPLEAHPSKLPPTAQHVLSADNPAERPIPPTLATPTRSPQPKSGRKAPFVGLAAVALVMLVGLGIASLRPPSSPSPPSPEVDVPLTLDPPNDPPEEEPAESAELEVPPRTDEPTEPSELAPSETVPLPTTPLSMRRAPVSMRTPAPDDNAASMTGRPPQLAVTPVPIPSRAARLRSAQGLHQARLDAEARIRGYQTGLPYLQRIRSRGGSARALCGSAFDRRGVDRDLLGSLMDRMDRTRGLVCEILDETNSPPAGKLRTIARIRSGFEGTRRRLERVSDSLITDDQRQELFRLLAAVESVVDQEPFPCFDPAIEALKTYARDLGARAAQPALQVSQQISNVCARPRLLPARERRFAENLDGAFETVRDYIQIQEQIRDRFTR